MAYRKQKERILAGSLNLLAPADKLPPEDSAELSNWRVDQTGQLRARKGVARVASGLAGEVHTLFRTGDARYAGVGSDLRLGTSLESLVTSGLDGSPLGMTAYQGFAWVMNRNRRLRIEGANAHNWGLAAPSSSPVPSAGSQTSVTIAEFDSSEAWKVARFSENEQKFNPTFEDVVSTAGSLSATNGSAAIVGTGTAFEPTMVGKNITVKGLDANVITTIAAVADATHLTLTTPYTDTTASGLTYSITETVSAVKFDAGNKQSGTHSLHVEANPAGRWQAELAIAKNLELDGEDRDDDQFRVWMYASDPAAITAISIVLFSASGAVSASVDPALLNPAVFSWTQVSIRRRLDAAAIVAGNQAYQDLLRRLQEAQEAGNQIEYDALNQARAELYSEVVGKSPRFEAVGQTQFDWSAVTKVQFEVTTSDAMDLHLDLAQMVGGGTRALEGELTYFITFDNDDGHESNPSPGSEAVVVNKQDVTLTAVPVSTDAQCVKRHIYRIGGSLQFPLRVGTIYDNVTTTFVDRLPDDRAQDSNLRIPEDRDLAPPASGVVGPYFGRLIAYSSDEFPARMWWTPVGQPAYFPGADDPADGNWQDAGDSLEQIYAVTNHRRLLIVYKERSIWRFEGDPDRSDPVETNANVGAVGRKAVCRAGSVDYFVGPEGIYRFNGDYEERISVKIDPIFKGDRVELGDFTAQPWAFDARSSCVLSFANGRLYFSYPEDGNTRPTATLVYDVESQRWTRLSLAVALGETAFTSLYYEGHYKALMGGTADGKVYQLETGDTDDGQAIFSVWQSRFMDQGVPDNPKLYADLVIDHKNASPMSVFMLYDNGPVEAIGSIFSGTRTRTVFPLGDGGQGQRAVNAAVRIEGEVKGQAVIYGVYLHFYAEAREGLSFDTGVVDLGSALVKQLHAIDLDLTAAAAVTWTLFTDLPGSAIAQRRTGSIAVTAGRKSAEVTISPVIDGRRVRLVLTSSAKFQLHALKMRRKEVGEYIDGAAGEFWESVPLG